MGTTYSAMKSRLLTKLRDPNQQEWTDDTELYGLISNAEQWLATYLGSLRGSGRFVVQEAITLAANTSTVAISSLSAAATKVFLGVRYMDMLTEGGYRAPMLPIPDGDEAQYRAPTQAPVGGMWAPGYFIRDDSFIFLPVASQARTIYLTYQWIPIVKTSGSDTLETPTQYDDMILLRAAFDALGAEGENETTFEQKYATRLADIEDAEVNRLGRGITETVKTVTSRVLFN